MTDNDAQIYIRARYYNPYFTRWNKLDIIRGNITSPLSLNRYAYNMGDSVNHIDINGKWFGVGDFIFTVGGAATGIISQFISDIIASVVESFQKGKLTFKFSYWKIYVSAGIGRAVAVESSLYVSPVMGAGIVEPLLV